MKNFKKIALGLLVGAAAIAFSSFTNARVETKSHTNTWYYTLDHATGKYIFYGENTMPNVADLCETSAPYDCAVGFSSNKGSTVSAPATGTDYTSGTDAYYNY